MWWYVSDNFATVLEMMLHKLCFCKIICYLDLLQCLLNETVILGHSQCGDGYVDDDEVCDCGTIEVSYLYAVDFL